MIALANALTLSEMTESIRANASERVISTKQRISWIQGVAHVQVQVVFGRITMSGYKTRCSDWHTMRRATSEDQADVCSGRMEYDPETILAR